MSPVVLAPVSTAYCSLSLAPPPPSVIYQPVGSAVFVVDPAVFDSVSKFSVTALPAVVRLTLPVPVSARTSWTTKVKEQPISMNVDTSSGRTRSKTAVKKMCVFMGFAEERVESYADFRLRRQHYLRKKR